MWQRSFWLSFDKKVSDFPSSEDSSDEWLSEKLRNWNFHSEAANKSCSTKISVLQEPVLECSFFVFIVKSLKKYVWKSSFLVIMQVYSQQLY